MTISLCPITGSVPMPNGAAPDSGVLVFKLSAVDSEDSAGIPPAPVSVTLGALGVIPDTFPGVWRNTEGSRGTSYAVSLIVRELIAHTAVYKNGTYPLGSIQVGDADSYSIGELLAAGASPAPSWNLNHLLDDDDGLLEQTAPGVIVKRTIGALAGTSILTRADSDARYGLTGLATRAALVALLATLDILTPGMMFWADGLGYRYTGAGNSIADMPGVVPAGRVYAQQFGAPEDYDQATGTYTAGDLAAINAAMAYQASERKPGLAGGKVWIIGRAYVEGDIVPPRGVSLWAVTPVSSTGQGSTVTSAYPITYNEGSGIVGGHTAGPVILLSANDTGVYGLTIGATAARRAAAISSGAQNRNVGVLIEPADTSTANMQRITVDGTLVRDQPADAYYACGNFAELRLINPHAHNCGGHGFVEDEGTLSGRTHKARGGIFTLDHGRFNNLGGHVVCLGSPTEAVGYEYRSVINNTEGFRSCNDPAVRYASSGWFVSAENLSINNSAFGATSGLSSTVPVDPMDHALTITGRNVHCTNCRYIGQGLQPVNIIEGPLAANRDIRFIGGYAGTSEDPTSDYFVKVDDQVRGLVMEGLSGEFADIIDVAAMRAMAGTNFGHYIDGDGIHEEWGITRAAVPLTGFLNIGASVSKTIVAGAITATSSNVRLATGGGAADLRVINGGSDGDILVLQSAVATDDVTLKNRVSGTDNIRLTSGADKLLDHSLDQIMLKYRASDSMWIEIAGFADNGT